MVDEGTDTPEPETPATEAPTEQTAQGDGDSGETKIDEKSE